jgi:hypothetical protein
MQNFAALTNTGRVINIKARSYNAAWRKANEIAGSEWIVEMSHPAKV